MRFWVRKYGRSCVTVPVLDNVAEGCLDVAPCLFDERRGDDAPVRAPAGSSISLRVRRARLAAIGTRLDRGRPRRTCDERGVRLGHRSGLSGPVQLLDAEYLLGDAQQLVPLAEVVEHPARLRLRPRRRPSAPLRPADCLALDLQGLRLGPRCRHTWSARFTYAGMASGMRSSIASASPMLEILDPPEVAELAAHEPAPLVARGRARGGARAPLRAPRLSPPTRARSAATCPLSASSDSHPPVDLDVLRRRGKRLEELQRALERRAHAIGSSELEVRVPDKAVGAYGAPRSTDRFELARGSLLHAHAPARRSLPPVPSRPASAA